MKTAAGVRPPSTPGAQQMYATCRVSCVGEGYSDKLCRDNCDCHLEKMRSGLSDAELERMIGIATEGSEVSKTKVRRWMRDTAIECQQEVLGRPGGEKP